jgi:hypothetical protein
MRRWYEPGVVAMVAAVMSCALPAVAVNAADPLPDPTKVIVARSGTTAKPHKTGPDNNTPTWANNSLTGYCGQTDGGFVIAAQLLLYAYGLYPGPIDNYWGPKSHSALLNYQAARGLQRDGCAGPDTWLDLQRQTKLIGSSSECTGPGSLRNYQYSRASRWAYYDRSTQSLYWFGDTHLQPRGGPVGDHLYRFSDDLKAYC